MVTFTAKDISSAFQIDMPIARAVLKVCKMWSRRQGHDLQLWLDKHCQTFGVEGIYAEYDSTDFLFGYLNAGDTYNTTLIFFNDGRIELACWGDMIEGE